MRMPCGSCLISSLLAFSFVAAQQTKPVSKTIDAAELARLLETPGKVFFLDVRDPDEIAKLGSVEGYVNIPINQLPARLGEIPKDKLIVTV